MATDNPSGEQIFRVGGSGYTVFHFNNAPLAYVNMLRDQAPQPVAEPEPIQPIDCKYPIEIAFPRAHGVGVITVEFLEQWNDNVWGQLPAPFQDAADIIDVFDANLRAGNLQCVKIIKKTDSSGRLVPVRKITYHGCKITRIDESEEIMIGTMTLPKSIDITYTHKTRTKVG